MASLFTQFKVLVEREFNHNIINVYSVNGGEFVALRSYFNSHGISWLTTAPHTPEQNGAAERRHRHFTETIRALLHHASLPATFWSYATQTAVYLINRLPTPLLQHKSPFEVLFKCSSTYLKLHIFIVYVFLGSSLINQENLPTHLDHASSSGTLHPKVPIDASTLRLIACSFYAMLNFQKIHSLACLLPLNQGHLFLSTSPLHL